MSVGMFALYSLYNLMYTQHLVQQNTPPPSFVVSIVSKEIPVSRVLRSPPSSRSVQLTSDADLLGKFLSEIDIQPMEESQVSIPSSDIQSAVHTLFHWMK